MKKASLALLIAAAALLLTQNSQAAGRLILRQTVAGGGGCAQATTFLARTSGLSGTETTAYTNLICGLVTDGNWCGTTIDVLYILATNTTTTAALNLCSTSFSLVTHGTPTFSADHGYTGDAVAAYLDTQFNPNTAGGNYTQNSATIGVYDLTNRVASANKAAIGVAVTDYAIITPRSAGGGVTDYEINAALFPATTNATAQGSWLATRTSSVAVALYRNGSSVASSGADTSAALSNLSADFCLLTICSSGGGGGFDFSDDQIAAAFIGAGVTSTVAGQIQSRINAYMTALGINVY